jgi:hypothetical protein
MITGASGKRGGTARFHFDSVSLWFCSLGERQANTNKEGGNQPMKKFLQMRWCRLPVGIIAAVLAVCLLTGVAFAAYTLFSGGAQVTVTEAITWGSANGDGSWDSVNGQWTVSMYPGETKTLNLGLYNAGSVALPVTVSFTGPADPALGGNGVYTVPASGGLWIAFTATASSSAIPGPYTYTITMTR